MKLKRILVCFLVVVLTLSLFSFTVFALAPSYVYTSDGYPDKVQISTENATMGLIDPGPEVAAGEDFNWELISDDPPIYQDDVWHFTAIPNPGYEFDYWETTGDAYLGSIDKSTAVLQIQYKYMGLWPVEAYFSAIAHFKAIVDGQDFAISTSVEHGTITPTESNIPAGSNRTITYSPDPGYYLISVYVDMAPVDITVYPSSYTFNDIQISHMIHVVYGEDVSTDTNTGTILMIGGVVFLAGLALIIFSNLGKKHEHN